MKRVPDATGRLPVRPHYVPEELDSLCEGLITEFLVHLHGSLALPISTDDLEKLIERDAADLDLYADLSAEGNDVEGVTYFIPNEKPRVRISKSISGISYREHRLRTTLTHEYGHVNLHAPLWNTSAKQLSLFSDTSAAIMHKCHRAAIFGNTAADWMEWQAGYMCGALLMPVSRVRQRVQAFYAHYELPPRLQSTSAAAVDLQQQIANLCDVSVEAARVRLTKLGYLVDDYPGNPLIS